MAKTKKANFKWSPRALLVEFGKINNSIQVQATLKTSSCGSFSKKGLDKKKTIIVQLSKLKSFLILPFDQKKLRQYLTKF
jgi:hypothetical protein